MRKLSIAELKTEFTKLNYKWFDFHFIGIRSKEDKPNAFDDLFILVDKNNIFYFECTTNPGVHWLQNLLNPKGAALLKANQYLDGWKLGLHQGKYEAFVQNKAVEVYRDKNLDQHAEITQAIDKGFFGINIHRANPSAISKVIDKWSAGCQVLNNPADFKLLVDKAKESKLNAFTYTLLNETIF